MAPHPLAAVKAPPYPDICPRKRIRAEPPVVKHGIWNVLVCVAAPTELKGPV